MQEREEGEGRCRGMVGMKRVKEEKEGGGRRTEKRWQGVNVQKDEKSLDEEGV